MPLSERISPCSISTTPELEVSIYDMDFEMGAIASMENPQNDSEYDGLQIEQGRAL
jgi:hypothetical protein